MKNPNLPLDQFEELARELVPRRNKLTLYWRYVSYGIIRFFTNIVPDIKRFYQRGKYGIAEEDSWSLDRYLADIINRGVNHLKNTTQGCPGELTECEWVMILEDIAFAFNIMKKTIDGEIHYLSIDGWNEGWFEEIFQFCEESEEQTKFYSRPITEEETIRVDRGFKLFQKHFLHLWD